MCRRGRRGGSARSGSGRDGIGFFLIESGEAKITVDGEEIGSLDSGNSSPEMALIDGGPRSATVKAVTELRCHEMTPWFPTARRGARRARLVDARDPGGAPARDAARPSRASQQTAFIVEPSIGLPGALVDLRGERRERSPSPRSRKRSFAILTRPWQQWRMAWTDVQFEEERMRKRIVVANLATLVLGGTTRRGRRAVKKQRAHQEGRQRRNIVRWSKSLAKVDDRLLQAKRVGRVQRMAASIAP